MYEIIIIVLFSMLLNFVISPLVIPFKGNNLTQIFNSNPKKDFLEDFIMSTFYNQLYAVIGIGLPNQNIVVNILPKQVDFIFNKMNCLFFYNNIYIDKNNLSPNNISSPINITKIGYIKNLSKSFEKSNITNLPLSYKNNNYFSGKEKLKIDDYRMFLKRNYIKKQIFPYAQFNLLQFSFIYEETNINNDINKNEEICGSIGLDLYNEKNNNKFIEQLRSSNTTKNYYWSFKYFSFDKGNIVFGILPHEYNPDKYKSGHLIETYTNIEEGSMKWSMDLNEIYFFLEQNKKEKISVKSVISEGEFDFCLQLIIGSFSYKELIIKYFFKEFYDKKIYEEEEYKLEINYSIIRCKKEKFERKISTFPNLFLYNRLLQNTFELSYEDLFIKLNDYIYFLVIFRKEGEYKTNQTWKLGIPFLKRHQIIFNSDTKRIGYYVKNKIYMENNKDNNDNNKNLNNNKESKNFFDSIKKSISLRTFIEIIIIIIFILILIYFGKNTFNLKIKRKKPYELQDEDYDYFSHNKKKKENFDINNNMDDNNILTGQIIEMKSH